jgi:glycine dehydrogenase
MLKSKAIAVKRREFIYIDNETISISVNETILSPDINQVIAIFAEVLGKKL